MKYEIYITRLISGSIDIIKNNGTNKYIFNVYPISAADYKAQAEQSNTEVQMEEWNIR